MTPEEFLNKFETLAETPNAVAGLRRFVIHLAVRGELAANDAAEKPVGLPLSGAAELAGLPRNWRTGVVGDVFQFEYGENLPAPKRSGSGEYPVYGSNGIVGTHDKPLTRSPAVIVGRKGSAGALNIADGPSWTTDVAYFVCPPPEVDLRFTYYLLCSLRLNELGKGIKPGLSRKDVYRLPIAMPPIAEQKRIVAKVDELMALCDRLEAQQQEREHAHAALTHAAFARFADAPTAENLEYLFHASFDTSPEELRQSILQMAIRGKLVDQRPASESAAALLVDIGRMKSDLAAEGKLRGGATVRAMQAEDGDFAVPGNWAWVRFGDIVVNRDGERIPVSKEVRATKAKTYDYYGASGVIDKIDGYLFDKPLLLIGEDGANLLNRSTPIAFIARGKYWVNNHAHVLDGISEDLLQYLALYINAISLEPYVTGSAQPKMNQAKMNSIPVALPPVAEQRRIVAKVSDLMALVDRLEADLAAARATGEKLMDAVVAELTAAG